MLTQLMVSNYAIAERVDLHFSKGMTALTGETGAGKSIVLDALSLAMGGRADAGAVRHGAKRADITASFDISRIPIARQWLEEHELDDKDDCILRRTISKDGRSKAFINGQPCPLSQLKDLGGLLMDIHSQHQHQSLLQKDTHRKLLDEFSGAEDLAEQTRDAWKAWHRTSQKLEQRRQNADEAEAKLQLLRYQVEELDRLALGDGEQEALEQEQAQLSQADAVLHSSHQAALLCTEDETSAADLVRQALQQLEQLPVDVPALADTIQMLTEAQIQISEAGDNLRHFVEDYEADPARLAEVEERLSAIYQMARKHRITPEELPELHQRLSNELEELDGGEGSLEQLEAEQQALRKRFDELAGQLTAKREQAAAELDQRIAQELAQLSMPAVQFVTKLGRNSNDEPAPHGMEDVEFLVSANPGQPARPLAKVASGGELSRISLAIQVVVAQTSTTPTLVFDEVDVGIGGGTAEVVGRLLRSLGSNGQVLCVTHLPQVAAQCHQHLFVSKFTEQDATYSRIETLDDQGRISEVARMLGGVDMTEHTIAHAREMFVKGQATHH
ncbi:MULTISPECIES: DNA repair protein RecN [Marinobacter]|uniref:DNA repair protein RecN n=2 Tax=Marinobacter TaxID=2742 RepID=A0A1M2UV58_MARNT|nr:MULTISPECIES: DNA repair protein RecN [Marinobacter]MDX5438986.1 DNA repair protein RecN [Alteromonadaceae bacterium]WBU40750.1 DNA repair protein RecN [Marinobacter alkaliphilus]MAO11946.1 DNA repair protein RecN [Marinobacter sp.]MDX5335981.1 DNA repair protein RecN [Marinobacter sp.]MDX5387016.1 DNA repair protein RecN [Marinobacter sp.]